MHTTRVQILSKVLTVYLAVWASALVVIPSYQAMAAPSEKLDSLCARLIGGGSGVRIRSRLRQAINFQMEAALRHKLGEDWRKDLLTSSEFNWGQKNLQNSELAYLTAERKHVVGAAPVIKLSLRQNPGITDIKILKNFIQVLGGTIEDLDISDLALEGEHGYEDGVDQEDAESYFQMHDFLIYINQLNPGMKRLAISHLSGTYLNAFRDMHELQELDIHNSHFRTPVNNFVFRRHDPSGSISTKRWHNFLSSPPAKLTKLTIPPYFNNSDENLQQAEVLAARAGIELIKKNMFDEVRVEDSGWASLQELKIPLIINGRHVLVGLQSTILPPANADQNAANKIHRAVSNYIFWHLSSAHEIGLANVLYLEDGSLYANVKYRIGSNWYSLARELQRLGIPYSQRKAVSRDEWRHTSWDHFYMKHKAHIDHWARVNP